MSGKRTSNARRATGRRLPKAITLRLNEIDDAALVRQASELQVQPGTLARIRVRAGLAESRSGRSTALSALAGMTRRSQQGPSGDAVTLVHDARTALGASR